MEYAKKSQCAVSCLSHGNALLPQKNDNLVSKSYRQAALFAVAVWQTYD